MTIEEFLKECESLRDLKWSEEGALRVVEGRWQCPITALIARKLGQDFGVHMARTKGVELLGLEDKDAHEIVYSADAKISPLHLKLREALGCPLKSESLSNS